MDLTGDNFTCKGELFLEFVTFLGEAVVILLVKLNLVVI